VCLEYQVLWSLNGFIPDSPSRAVAEFEFWNILLLVPEAPILMLIIGRSCDFVKTNVV
jgi:hypothetical protein